MAREEECTGGVAEDREPDGDLLQIETYTEAGPPIEKVRDYYVTTAGGLENIALKDLKAHLKGLSRVRVEPGSRHGRIYFRYERSPRQLLSLRSVQNVYVLLREIQGVTPGRPGLLRIAKEVAAADIVPAVALHDVLHGPKEAPWLSISCTSGKGHRFSASELHQVVQTVVAGQYGIPERGEGQPYRLHLQVSGRRGLFGMQVPLRRLQDRDGQTRVAGGGLDSTLAYCMALLARVEPRDVCLDPACGDGVCLIEAGSAFGPRMLLGGGPDAGALAALANDAAGARPPVKGVAMGIDAIPLAAESVDKVLCDLRGRTPVPSRAARALGVYLTGIARVLRPARTAVLLVDDPRALNEAMAGDRGPFTQLQRVPIHVSGRRAWITVLKRKR